MRELANTNYECLLKNLISVVNEFLNKNNKFPEPFFSEKSSLISLGSLSDILKNKDEIPSEFLINENLQLNSEKYVKTPINFNFDEKNENINRFFKKNARKKWENKYFHTGKIPPPLYELFKKQKFSYQVMPSLKEKYLQNLSMKEDKEKTQEMKKSESTFFSLMRESKPRTYSFKKKSDENQENSVGNSPKMRLNTTGSDGLNLFTNFKAKMSQKYKK